MTTACRSGWGCWIAAHASSHAATSALAVAAVAATGWSIAVGSSTTASDGAADPGGPVRPGPVSRRTAPPSGWTARPALGDRPEARIAEPRTQADVRRHLRAVEQDRLAGANPTEDVDRRGTPVGAMLRHASPASVEVRRAVPLRPVLITAALTDVLARRGVRSLAAEVLRSMVVEHPLCSVVVRRLYLFHVLPPRQQRDAIAPGLG